MNLLSYFPEGVAGKSAFLNREIERKLLINRINANKHTVLIAPRRYGKTSLVIKVANEIKEPCCVIDLLAAYDESYVRDQIATKIGQLVMALLPKVKKTTETLINIFKCLKPEISIGAFGQKLTLTPSAKPLQDITEVLLKLDETAMHFKKNAVVFMDEFQQISQFKNYHSIEAAIRHAAERSQNIAYVFSGSNRHLLQQMFGDRGRPLYRLCQTITLERMLADVYRKNLQKLAKQKWQQPLSETTLQQIFDCSKRHPYYINVLCQRLWESEQLPDSHRVNACWCDYVRTQRHMISHDVTALSLNQRRVMVALAQCPVKQIQAVSFTASIGLSASSAQQSLDMLLQKDLVYQADDGAYHVLDPAIRFYLATDN